MSFRSFGPIVMAAMLSVVAGCDDATSFKEPSETEQGLSTGDGRILLFKCPSAMVEVHFLDEAVQFAWEGRSYRLPEVSTGSTKSVTRYAQDEAEVINRGSELSVRLPGDETMTCTQLEEDAVPRDPSLNPTDPPQ